MSETVQERREVSSFSQVTLGGVGNLIIEPGDCESLIIEASEHLVSRISSHVRDGELVICFKRPGGLFLWPSGPIKYHLTVKELEAIKVSGTGSVSGSIPPTDSLKLVVSGSGKIQLPVAAKQLAVRISGTGKLQLSGMVSCQEVTISGAGSYKAKELESTECRVTVSGSGSAVVQASERLDVIISGAGDVSYAGRPTVNQRVSGVGRVSRLSRPTFEEAQSPASAGCC